MMADEAMIERVAKAIVKALENCGDVDIESGVGWIFGNGSIDKQSAFKTSIARAAIEAMCVPTEAMLAEANRPLRGQEGFHNELPFEQQWRHAIDAALSEPGSPAKPVSE